MRVKQKTDVKDAQKHHFSLPLLQFIIGALIGLFIIFTGIFLYFEFRYSNRVYQGIYVGDLNAGGMSRDEIQKYFEKKSFPFSQINLVLEYEDKIATISGKDMDIAFDSKLSAEQAFSIGRSGHIISDLYQQLNALKNRTYLPVILHFDNDYLDDVLTNLSESIDLNAQDAQFTFENGKVSAFKISKDGQKLDVEKTKQIINEYVKSLTSYENIDHNTIKIPLPVYKVLPNIATENSNSYGIIELIGKGESHFAHSAASRIHNINLAASRINGRLVAPGATFSINDAIGDISAATGFEPAYIIKGGQTVLGDGGGVCQVSTTLFRAALNTGLPIVERYAHAYRVGYYEQDGPPGFDATIYAPNYDLKFKNDTGNYILIQTEIDIKNAYLAFNIYGTSDGRQVEISKPRIYGQSPPPPDLYQDDPTLDAGVIKQTDFAAPGAKVDFDYKVVKNGETLTEKTFRSNYRPWQAVFLRGTKT